MRADWQRPHPSRLDPGRASYCRIMAAHDAAVAAGEPGYTDPTTGSWVFTAATLAAKGSCCDQGCRHCPWVGEDLSGG